MPLVQGFPVFSENYSSDILMDITLLGTGSSTGVPQLLCNCPVCTSSNPKNKRSRFSILFSDNGTNILVDAPFESRLQLLNAKVSHIDLFWLTHPHSDHLAGIDDLRIFAFRNQISLPFYALPEHITTVQNKFPYLFFKNEYRDQPLFQSHPITHKTVTLKNAELIPIIHNHGTMEVAGFRWKNVAFLADISAIEESELDKLKGLELLIIAHTLKHKHFKHMNGEEVVALIQKINPKKAILTHMNHHFEYNTLKASLPENIEPGYDGMTISMP
ncbi:MBL fold metallo-hydrolase [bacterium]|nr:MBL fold metallo-hydrolase [bacterium]